MKNGGIIWTFNEPSVTAWSGGSSLYVATSWGNPKLRDVQWIDSEGEPVGPM